MAFFLDELANQGYLESVHITIGNIGSRLSIQSDYYGAQNWHLFCPNLTILGFDADIKACEEANMAFTKSQGEWNEFHIPIAIGNRNGTATLHVTKEPMCSSLFEPNETFLKRFLHLPDFVAIDYKEEITLMTLDSFCKSENIEEIDFLKIDVQGAGP